MRTVKHSIKNNIKTQHNDASIMLVMSTAANNEYLQ